MVQSSGFRFSENYANQTDSYEVELFVVFKLYLIPAIFLLAYWRGLSLYSLLHFSVYPAATDVP